jgi:type VI secretion system protein VasJ
MIERLTQAVASLESTILPEAHGARALKALAALRSEVPHAQLQAPPLERLVRCLDAARERAQQPPAPPAVSPTAFPATSPAISPAFFASTPAIALGNERETRQSLLKIADYLNQRDAYDPVGYQLRRVALWSELNSAPTARTDQRTELRNVPVDITYVYEDALVSQDASPPLLQRVEKSVAASPFWLRGSFLAATFARRLAMPDVADGIQQAAMRFLQRLPTLAQLRFHDGAPFVDDVTLSWLSENHASRSSDGETAEFAQRRAELMACLDNDGVETTLLRLQHMQAQATTPRQRGQVTCIAADVLAARGLTWLADGLYAVVRQTMETTSADQWEPEFHRELTPLDTRFRA